MKNFITEKLSVKHYLPMTMKNLQNEKLSDQVKSFPFLEKRYQRWKNII